MRGRRTPVIVVAMFPGTVPLIVTRDEALLEELLRLAAAAGVTPEVAAEPATALASWRAAPVVLVGADLAEPLARHQPARRDAVHVVSWAGVPDELFRTALDLGAQEVVELPRCEDWLVEALTDLGDQRRTPALTVGVVGGSGGAGATTFACALGRVAAGQGPAVVIDADPLGPGVDRVLGLEARPGIRWDALQHTTGRLGSRSFREALPRRDGLGVLSWSPGPQGSLQAFAIRTALSAAQRGHDCVVLDLPRTPDPLVAELVARCDRLVVLVAPTVTGVAAAARLCARYPEAARGLVVRGGGVHVDDIAGVTGTPVLAVMADQRSLDEAVNLGLGPVRSGRGPLARAAERVLGDLRAERPGR